MGDKTCSTNNLNTKLFQNWNTHICFKTLKISQTTNLMHIYWLLIYILSANLKNNFLIILTLTSRRKQSDFPRLFWTIASNYSPAMAGSLSVIVLVPARNPEVHHAIILSVMYVYPIEPENRLSVTCNYLEIIQCYR